MIQLAGGVLVGRRCEAVRRNVPSRRKGREPETVWVLIVLGFLVKLVLGILGLIVSVAWVAHITIYLLIDLPLSPFPNEVFYQVGSCLGSSGCCSICILLLLPSTCSDLWCNDIGSQISFHNHSSHKVGSYSTELISFQHGTHSCMLH